MSSDFPDHNPYDFIMNPGTPQPKRPIPLKVPTNGKNGFIVKIALIAGGAIVLLIAIMIGVSLLSSDDSNTTELTSLAQTQNEIIRVATQGGSSGRDQVTKNFAVNTNLSVSTQQLKIVNYLATKNIKLKPKELGMKESDTTTKQLTQAKATSTFDAAFLQIMQTSLDSYSNDLQKYYESSTSATVKKLLKADYEQTQLLRSQLPSSTSSAATTTTQ